MNKNATIIPHRLLNRLLVTVNYLRGKSSHPQLQMELRNISIVTDLNSLPKGYAIRTYREGDNPSWIGIIQEAFGKDIGEPPQVTLKHILTKPEFDSQGLIFVTFEDNPVGTVCALTLSSGRKKTGYIHMVAVAPEHQGKKIGRALTRAALLYFKKKGIKRVLLDTDDFRTNAIKLYLDIGFKPVLFDYNHRKRWARILANA